MMVGSLLMRGNYNNGVAIFRSLLLPLLRDTIFGLNSSFSLIPIVVYYVCTLSAEILLLGSLTSFNFRADNY